MRIEGNAGVYVGAQQGRPLPPVPADLHRPHRPWCRDCKRKFDEDALAERRCPGCAAAVITRAEGAARRAARDAEAVAAEERLLARVKPAAPEKPAKTRPTRRGTRRRAPAAARDGVSPLEVKRWAVGQGLLPMVAPGRVPRTVVDAYMAAGGSGADR